MRILILSPVVPYPPNAGLKIRVFNLARELARNHDVHLFCLSETPPEASRMEAIGEAGMELTVVGKPGKSLAVKLSTYGRRLARGVPPEFILSWEEDIFSALDRLGGRGFDVVVAEHLFMARYSLTLACPRVLVLHNIESDLARSLAATFPQPRRAYKAAASRWLSRYEKRMLSSMSGAVAVSEADSRRLEQLAPGLPATVVENGVDCTAFGETYGAPRCEGHRLLYLGLMSYESNIDAVTWFTREVLPLIREDFPETVFTIAGGDPAPSVKALAGPGVAVAGYVDDVRPLYRENDVMVVPLRHGGGSRLKILEAFAAGTPVVSTAKGTEGLEAEDGRHLLVADTPRDMAAAVAGLFRDPGAGRVLRENAAALALERYDWPRLAAKLDDFLVRMAVRP